MATADTTAGLELDKRFSWRSLGRWSAIAGIVVVALAMVLLGFFPPMLLFVAMWGIAAWLMSRSGKSGPILLLVSFVLFFALNAPFLIPALSVPASMIDFMLTLAIAVVSVVGIVAAIQSLRRRDDAAATGPRTLALVGGAVFLLGLVTSVVASATFESAVAQPGDFKLATEDYQFSATEVEVAQGDAVFIENNDIVLHTFTSEELDIDVDVPAGESVRVSIEGDAGSYEFICKPHESEMKGTITVR